MILRTGQLMSYAFLAVPLAFVSLPLYMYMPDFYATEYGISLGLLGSILLGIRLIDAVQDPVLGIWARKWQGSKPQLHRAMIRALCVLGVGVVALLCPLGLTTPEMWFAFTMIIATTALSLVTILYQTLGGLWSRDYHTRTRITATREGFTLLGVLIAVLLPSVFQQHYSPAQSFVLFALCFVAILMPATALWGRWLANVNMQIPDAAIAPLAPILRQAKSFFTVWFLSQLASAIPVVLVLFYIRDHLQLEEYTGAFLLVYFLSGALGMPLWRKLERSWGKKRTWQAAMTLAIISFGWAFMLQTGDWLGYGYVCLFSGLALGGELAIPPSLLADQLDTNNADKQATVLFSISTFLGKAALAIASGATLILLEQQGYQPASVGNDTQALNSLAFTYALLPCFIKSGALVVLTFSSIGTRSIDT